MFYQVDGKQITSARIKAAKEKHTTIWAYAILVSPSAKL
jgi:hypothetical protein